MTLRACMKKTSSIIIALLVVLVVLSLVQVGILAMKNPFAQEGVPGERSIEQKKNMSQERVSASTMYTNTAYTFALVFPKTWGELREEQREHSGEIFEAIIRIASRENADQYIDVYIVPSAQENHPALLDLPAVYVGAIEDTYTYFISSGVADGMPENEDPNSAPYAREVQEIRDSFRIVQE